MSLKEKAAKVNFGDLDEDSAQVPTTLAAAARPETAQPTRPRTTGVAGITDRINLHHQVQDLQSQVAAFEGAQLVVKLDPRRVKESKWKNRHELAYSTKEYAELKAEIEAAGGNVSPIKVRRKGKGADGQDEYEIVYGRRRNRACLESGFEVAAIVEELDDIQLLKEMERENRNRADLSPWEQGVMYEDALDAKLFGSQRQMAAALNVSLGGLSMALALAALPEEVINAFPSPLALQYRWASDINAALEKDTARVMTVARELAARPSKPAAKEVLAALLATPRDARAGADAKPLKIGERVVGSLAKDARGGLNLKVKGGVLTPANEKKLMDFLERLLS